MAKAATKPSTKTPTTPPAMGVVNWRENLAKLAKVAASVEHTGGNKIETTDGILAYRGTPFPGNKVPLVVLTSAEFRAYFDTPWDPDSKSFHAPPCFSLCAPGGKAVPHENSARPQHGQCVGCKWDAFGTASNRKGKACREKRRLIVIPEGGLVDVAKAEFAYLEVPVTSVPNFKKYVKDLEALHHVPTFAAVTEVSSIVGGRNKYTLNFRLVSLIEDPAQLEALVGALERAETEAMRPYDKPTEPEDPAPNRKY